jgi:hypothetical protein
MPIELSSGFKMTLWLIGLFTCGVGALGLWLTARSWPRIMDDEGITLRNGKRVLWRDCTRVVQVSAVAEGGGRISGRAELEFGAVKVPLVPQSVAQGQAMLDYASRRVGTLVQSG